MKSRNQQGSAHLIIIIALVVVVLGALGVVFWQNFANKSDSASDASTKSSTVSSKRSTSIPEWGVKGSYTYTKDLDYSFISTGDSVYLELTTPTIYADKYCSKAHTGIINRYKADELVYDSIGSEGVAASLYYGSTDSSTAQAAQAHVGDYYYFMTSPQGLCVEDENSAMGIEVADVYGATKQFVNSLQAE